MSMGYWILSGSSKRYDIDAIEDAVKGELTNHDFDVWLNQRYKASDIIKMMEINGWNPSFDLGLYDSFIGEALDSMNIQEGQDVFTRRKAFIYVDDRKRSGRKSAKRAKR